MTDAERLRHAESLLVAGFPDDQVEQLADVSLTDIVTIRAKLASDHSALGADHFPGRPWWRRSRRR